MTAGSPVDPEYLALCQKLHDQACLEGKQSYTDPKTGYMVFTRLMMLERGYCCESGCRHCPYGFVKRADKPATTRR